MEENMFRDGINLSDYATINGLLKLVPYAKDEVPNSLILSVMETDGHLKNLTLFTTNVPELGTFYTFTLGDVELTVPHIIADRMYTLQEGRVKRNYFFHKRGSEPLVGQDDNTHRGKLTSHKTGDNGIDGSHLRTSSPVDTGFRSNPSLRGDDNPFMLFGETGSRQEGRDSSFSTTQSGERIFFKALIRLLDTVLSSREVEFRTTGKLQIDTDLVSYFARFSQLKGFCAMSKQAVKGSLDYTLTILAEQGQLVTVYSAGVNCKYTQFLFGTLPGTLKCSFLVLCLLTVAMVHEDLDWLMSLNKDFRSLANGRSLRDALLGDIFCKLQVSDTTFRQNVNSTEHKFKGNPVEIFKLSIDSDA